MKHFLSIFLFLALTSLLSCQAKTSKKYDFSSVDLEGNKISSQLYAENKITMINIWGTFCGPCIREMPDLEKLNQANKGKDFQIVGIVIDLTDYNGKIISSVLADAETIIAGTGVSYKNIVPSRDMLTGFLRNIMAVPTTIFVDKDGNQLGELYMGSKSQKEWQKIIDELMKKL